MAWHDSQLQQLCPPQVHLQGQSCPVEQQTLQKGTQGSGQTQLGSLFRQTSRGLSATWRLGSWHGTHLPAVVAMPGVAWMLSLMSTGMQNRGGIGWLPFKTDNSCSTRLEVSTGLSTGCQPH